MNRALSEVGDFGTAARRVVVLGLVVGFCSWWSITFTRGPAGLSTLWAASGLLCGILTTSPRHQWPAYLSSAFVAFLVVNRLSASSWFISLSLSTANTLEAFVVAWFISHSVDDVTAPAHIMRVARFGAASTAVACALATALVASVLAPASTRSWGALFATGFASHSLGMIIFGTLTVVARAEGRRLFGRPGRRAELILMIAFTALICFAVFAQSRYPLLFLIYPALLLTVFRHRFSGFVLGTTAIAIIATTETVSGYGPFTLIRDAGQVELTVLLQVFIASTCLLALPVALVLTERRLFARRAAESEHRYRVLADYSRDLVVHLDASGEYRYLSPSASQMLGWTSAELRELRWELIHPDDREPMRQALRNLSADAGASTITFRARHKDGHYLWIEAHACLVPAPRDGDPPEIIYAGRDVTRRVAAEQALQDNQRRLRAITDNLPAIVLHVDTEEKYTFANAYTGNILGVDQAAIVGRSVRDVLGSAIYANVKPHLGAALRGETVTFEMERHFLGHHRYFQSTYVPDIGVDGAVNGVYGMTFDISSLKRAEQKLMRLARYDALTGLANRLNFQERLELAIARHLRNARPIALLYLDIDQFKQVNDSLGHAVGDRVLCEFAHRLNDSVRTTDFAARIGGDEFTVLIEDLEGADTAELIAAKLIGRMREHIDAGGKELMVTVSIGVACCRRPVSSPDMLMTLADNALYEAKAAGRNTFRLVT
jgi:diguanylate cyclase (GGDEF)-like protein/PAS domain S-box-containing protein